FGCSLKMWIVGIGLLDICFWIVCFGLYFGIGFIGGKLYYVDFDVSIFFEYVFYFCILFCLEVCV
ncbi:hypothetical protein DF186_19000, partial [Enterococcus hirae]